MLSDADAGIRTSIGVSGAGKTYGIRSSIYRSARHMPIVVIDTNEEWASVPRELQRVTAGALDMDAAIAAIARGARLVIVRPADLESAAHRAFEWAIERPRSDGVRGIAIPEAHLVLPNRAITSEPRAVQLAVLAWRHRKVALWLDTQRFAQLSVTVRDQSRITRLYAQGKSDMDKVQEWGGRALADRVRECAERFRRGEPGWHVPIHVAPIPPFEVSRDP